MEARRERDDNESESEECARVDELFENAVRFRDPVHAQSANDSVPSVPRLKGIGGSTLLLTPRS